MDFNNPEEELRCCKDGGTYNGLLCQTNEICDNDTNTCIKGWGFKPYPQPNNKGPHDVMCGKIQKDDPRVGRYNKNAENPNSESTGYSINWSDDSPQELKLYTSLQDCEEERTKYVKSSARCIEDSIAYEASIKYTDANGNLVPWPPPSRHIKNKNGGGPYYDNNGSGFQYGGLGPWFTNDGQGRCKRTSFRQAVKNFDSNNFRKTYMPWRDDSSLDHCKLNNMTTTATDNGHKCFENGVTYPKDTYMCGRLFMNGKPLKFAWKKCTKDEGCKTAAAGNQGIVDKDWEGKDTGKPTTQDSQKIGNINIPCDPKGLPFRDDGDCQKINWRGQLYKLDRRNCDYSPERGGKFICDSTKPSNFFCINQQDGSLAQTCKSVWDRWGSNTGIDHKCNLMDTKHTEPVFGYGIGARSNV